MNDMTKHKIACTLRGRKKSATHRRAIAEGLRGLHKTKEHRDRIYPDKRV